VENITVSFSASPATDKVKSKTQMNTCETKIQKDRSLLVFSSFLRFSPTGEIKHPNILSGKDLFRQGLLSRRAVYNYPAKSD
jgi:hypothetical protein